MNNKNQLSNQKNLGDKKLNQDVQQSSYKGDVPVGIKIISVLYYIGAGLSALFGLVFVIMGVIVLTGTSIETPVDATGLISSIYSMLGVFGVIAGIILFLFAILSFFIAKHLKKAKNWARILVLISSILGFLASFYSLLRGDFTYIINLIITGLISWYLLFEVQVKDFFSRN